MADRWSSFTIRPWKARELSRRGNDVDGGCTSGAHASRAKDSSWNLSTGEKCWQRQGSGLLYVGARGTWYPNRGMEMADFDLQFSYPPAGRWSRPENLQRFRRSIPKATGQQVTRWVRNGPFHWPDSTWASTGRPRRASVVSVSRPTPPEVWSETFPTGQIQVIAPPPQLPMRRPTGDRAVPAFPGPE